MINDKARNDLVFLQCEKEGAKCTFITRNDFIVIKSENYHFHSNYEIHLPISGSLHILAEDTDIIIHPGEICIIPPNKTHYVFPDENSCRAGFRFSFTSGNELFDEIYGNMDCITVAKNCDIYNKYIVRAVEIQKNNLPDFMAADLLFHAIYETACSLYDGEISATDQNVDYYDIILAGKIEDFLNMNYTEKIHLTDLAEYLNLGKRQTERVTDKYFGTTFSPLLKKKRLSTAKFLLKTTDLSIDEISVISGFEDKNYFYRKFSAAFGTTPGKYRKNHM